MASAIGGQNLVQIYGVYEKLKGKTPMGPNTTAAGETATPTASASTAAPPTEDQKKQAEGLKSQGNTAMAQKNYKDAIEFYSKALALVPGNPIFLSNRAAAYSASKDHESARADAEAAVASDPAYTKAWSRLGLARYALGDAKGSMEAYQKGIDYEGNGGSDAMKKGFETAKRRVEELEEEDDVTTTRGTGGAGGMPDLSSLASMLGGGGGAGGAGGGMPDFSQIMNNPMFASMAQNLMSNPDMMNNLMSNPRLREMASQLGGGGGGGGGTPDIAAMMQDPSIAEM